MPQVPETSLYAVWCRVLRRRHLKSGGAVGARNAATFFWTDNLGRPRATTRMSENFHSEKEIWQAIAHECATLLWVYTEREPCGGCTQGCSHWFFDVNDPESPVHKVDPKFTVYWTWPYPNADLKTFESGHVGAPQPDFDTQKVYFQSFDPKLGSAIRGMNVIDGPGKPVNKFFNKIILAAEDVILQAYAADPIGNAVKADIRAQKDLFQGSLIDLGVDPRTPTSGW